MMQQAQRRSRFGQSESNRSLVRGVEILRTFRPGIDLLGNGEISERTGLSKSTTSRLTQTLVHTGLLDHDVKRRGYRLSALTLALAHAMRVGSPAIALAAPRMKAASERLHLNVGLAVADRDAMVYLESVRYNPKASLRSIAAGQRVPIELTSLGRAYISTLLDADRHALINLVRSYRPSGWKWPTREIEAAVAGVRKHGYCAAAWQPGVVAVATPLQLSNWPTYVLNMSTSAHAPPAIVARKMRDDLLALRQDLLEVMKGL
ncbi:IclR family transcriptional regulator [Afipia sp. P52-10]|uniref:IclR family transcriptional regulator n=1 Tax=Afipia sp. P52-10 TaxID=1429916 RepID=UPI0004B39FF5|nr:helix-turn-helix domain-containing protein [Afipia sp. P52-10]